MPSAISNQKTGFLEESPGSRSSMRLMCMMALITAIILSGVVVGQSLQQSSRPITPGTGYPARDPEILYIIFGFLISAFAPKAVQKFAEQKLQTYDRTQAVPAVPTVYAGFLPPATPVATPAPVAVVPVAAPAQAVAPAQAPAPVSVTAEPAAGPTALQTVLQRGAL